MYKICNIDPQSFTLFGTFPDDLLNWSWSNHTSIKMWFVKFTLSLTVHAIVCSIRIFTTRQRPISQSQFCSTWKDSLSNGILVLLPGQTIQYVQLLSSCLQWWVNWIRASSCRKSLSSHFDYWILLWVHEKANTAQQGAKHGFRPTVCTRIPLNMLLKPSSFHSPYTKGIA